MSFGLDSPSVTSGDGASNDPDTRETHSVDSRQVGAGLHIAPAARGEHVAYRSRLVMAVFQHKKAARHQMGRCALDYGLQTRQAIAFSHQCQCRLMAERVADEDRPRQRTADC